MYGRYFDENTKKVFEEDKNKFLVISWIVFNINRNEKLSKNQCYFSYSTIEEELSINHRQMLKIIKQLEEDGVISWDFKSKTKYKKSILNFNEVR